MRERKRKAEIGDNQTTCFYHILSQSSNATWFYFDNIFGRANALGRLARLQLSIEPYFSLSNMPQTVKDKKDCIGEGWLKKKMKCMVIFQ